MTNEQDSDDEKKISKLKETKGDNWLAAYHDLMAREETKNKSSSSGSYPSRKGMNYGGTPKGRLISPARPLYGKKPELFKGEINIEDLETLQPSQVRLFSPNCYEVVNDSQIEEQQKKEQEIKNLKLDEADPEYLTKVK
mmetsp:Transcript_22323/g.34557  ORF Transcript_22323/g.34557 Transcript_22323/m.34557 type:complete len:139 (-) Transcript_22323:584-1000(-)